MDLGSGDGRTVITAAKRGATAMGVEYNPDMVELSKANAAKENVSAKATFVKADLYETDFSKATVITMFLLPEINVKLRPKILNLKPGTRVVSNSFTMEDWEADQTETISGECTSWCTALLWIVPAKVGGYWNWQLAIGGVNRGYASVFEQHFQTLEGVVMGTLADQGATLSLVEMFTSGQIAARVTHLPGAEKVVTEAAKLDKLAADACRSSYSTPASASISRRASRPSPRSGRAFGASAPTPIRWCRGFSAGLRSLQLLWSLNRSQTALSPPCASAAVSRPSNWRSTICRARQSASSAGKSGGRG